MSSTPSSEQAADGRSDAIPLLPRGTVILESIPLRAVVMEELAPVIGDGTLVVRDRDRGAVILVRDEKVFEVHVFEGGYARPGIGRIQEVQGWTGARVWADRLDHPLVDLCGALLRGETLYEDLRLSWVDWPSLMADLGSRGGTYVLEITTPAGRGVTCVASGRQALSYTDIHPSLGDPALLEAMASNREGNVRVRRVAADAFEEGTVESVPVTTAPQQAPAPAPADHSGNGAAASAEPGTGPARDWPATRWERPGPASGPVDAAQSQAAPTSEAALPDLAWVAPWEASWRDSSAEQGAAQPAEAGARGWTIMDRPKPAGSLSLGDVIADLRAIAQRRLQLSAGRVEAILEEGAAEHRSIDSVLDELRAMSIRGVMQSTVEEMVNEMAAAAEHRPAH